MQLGERQMSYEGDGGEVSAIYRPTADVPALVSPTGSMTFVAPGSVTKGQFGLFRRDMEARAGGPDPHFHRTFSESFYILYGTVALYGGEGWIEATAGDFLYVPEGGVHAFSNPSNEPAAMLILFSPGAPRERYFEALAEIRQSGRKLSAQEWTELYAEHDQYMVEPAGGTP
jgi:mannose-6-phosphate isomerase-like protein (cupin superfamily)